MRAKQIPYQLIRVMEERYADEESIDSVRKRVENYAREVFDLNHEQLVCMVFAPFASAGKGLSAYLTSQHPAFAKNEPAYRKVLCDDSSSTSLVEQLESWSGLSIKKLRHIYQSPLINNYSPDAGQTHPIARMFARDPHQKLICTRHSADGPPVYEIESGR